MNNGPREVVVYWQVNCVTMFFILLCYTVYCTIYVTCILCYNMTQCVLLSQATIFCLTVLYSIFWNYVKARSHRPKRKDFVRIANKSRLLREVYVIAGFERFKTLLRVQIDVFLTRINVFLMQLTRSVCDSCADCTSRTTTHNRSKSLGLYDRAFTLLLCYAILH